ncbi:hypothetical protein [Candidatus Nitrosocosmicus hydrocola]|uniref:hypothetical protein n=1 Tax=Candidatus Nitrosocosmicus hydrocola TaxID=1826872 RepID=UPI0011E5FF79|nr:hypothetical protein [Candidatus Nitrosocosmicus hydrocola]
MYLTNISNKNNKVMIFITISYISLGSTINFANAENFTINDGEVTKLEDNISSTLKYTNPINQDGSDGAMGVAIISNNGTGAVLASTTHGGIFDSSSQKNASDPVWHNHFAKLMAGNSTGNKCGGDLMVEELTFESPGNLTIINDTMEHSQLPTNFNATSSFSNNSLNFVLGENIDKVVTFKLEPKSNPYGDIEAVCVTNIQPAKNISIP